jgi:hypothetical protein
MQAKNHYVVRSFNEKEAQISATAAQAVPHLKLRDHCQPLLTSSENTTNNIKANKQSQAYPMIHKAKHAPHKHNKQSEAYP